MRPPRLLRAVTLALALALVACGEKDEPGLSEGTPEPPLRAAFAGADADDVRVIRAWSRTLARGDVAGAARRFALPSIAQNGPTLRIDSPAEARAFNASLPCGARLVAAETQGDFTTATFRLTERPGPGRCGPGTGGRAQTAFRIEDGKIAEWRRVGLPGPEPSGQAS